MLCATAQPQPSPEAMQYEPYAATAFVICACDLASGLAKAADSAVAGPAATRSTALTAALTAALAETRLLDHRTDPAADTARERAALYDSPCAQHAAMALGLSALAQLEAAGPHGPGAGGPGAGGPGADGPGAQGCACVRQPTPPPVAGVAEALWPMLLVLERRQPWARQLKPLAATRLLLRVGSALLAQERSDSGTQAGATSAGPTSAAQGTHGPSSSRVASNTGAAPVLLSREELRSLGSVVADMAVLTATSFDWRGPKSAAAAVDLWRLVGALARRQLLTSRKGAEPLEGLLLTIESLWDETPNDHDDEGRWRFHTSVPPGLAAALAGGALPFLERMFRRSADRRDGGEDGADGDGGGDEGGGEGPCWENLMLTSVRHALSDWWPFLPLLAYGEPRQAAAFVITVSKLLRCTSVEEAMERRSPGFAVVGDMCYLLSHGPTSVIAEGPVAAAARCQLALVLSLALPDWLTQQSRLEADGEDTTLQELNALSRSILFNLEHLLGCLLIVADPPRAAAEPLAGAPGRGGAGVAPPSPSDAVDAPDAANPANDAGAGSTSGGAAASPSSSAAAASPSSSAAAASPSGSAAAASPSSSAAAASPSGSAAAASPSSSAAAASPSGSAAAASPSSSDAGGAPNWRSTLLVEARVEQLVGAALRLIEQSGTNPEVCALVGWWCERLPVVCPEAFRRVVSGAGGGAVWRPSGLRLVASYYKQRGEVEPPTVKAVEALDGRLEAQAAGDSDSGGNEEGLQGPSAPDTRCEFLESLGGALSSLLVSPAEARRRLGLPTACSNPACANLAGDSEAGLRLQRCGRCVRASYCCRECQTAHWRSGHKAECGPATRLLVDVGVSASELARVLLATDAMAGASGRVLLADSLLRTHALQASARQLAASAEAMLCATAQPQPSPEALAYVPYAALALLICACKLASGLAKAADSAVAGPAATRSTALTAALTAALAETRLLDHVGRLLLITRAAVAEGPYLAIDPGMRQDLDSLFCDLLFATGNMLSGDARGAAAETDEEDGPDVSDGSGAGAAPGASPKRPVASNAGLKQAALYDSPCAQHAAMALGLSALAQLEAAGPHGPGPGGPGAGGPGASGPGASGPGAGGPGAGGPGAGGPGAQGCACVRQPTPPPVAGVADGLWCMLNVLERRRPWARQLKPLAATRLLLRVGSALLAHERSDSGTQAGASGTGPASAAQGRQGPSSPRGASGSGAAPVLLSREELSALCPYVVSLAVRTLMPYDLRVKRAAAAVAAAVDLWQLVAALAGRQPLMSGEADEDQDDLVLALGSLIRSNESLWYQKGRDDEGRWRFHPSVPPGLAAALAGGALPFLERLFRRSADRRDGGEDGADGDGDGDEGGGSSCWENRMLTSIRRDALPDWFPFLPLLAYGEPRQAAAFVITVSKLVRSTSVEWVTEHDTPGIALADDVCRLLSHGPTFVIAEGPVAAAARCQLALVLSLALPDWLAGLSRLVREREAQHQERRRHAERARARRQGSGRTRAKEGEGEETTANVQELDAVARRILLKLEQLLGCLLLVADPPRAAAAEPLAGSPGSGGAGGAPPSPSDAADAPDAANPANDAGASSTSGGPAAMPSGCGAAAAHGSDAAGAPGDAAASPSGSATAASPSGSDAGGAPNWRRALLVEARVEQLVGAALRLIEQTGTDTEVCALVGWWCVRLPALCPEAYSRVVSGAGGGAVWRPSGLRIVADHSKRYYMPLGAVEPPTVKAVEALAGRLEAQAAGDSDSGGNGEGAQEPSPSNTHGQFLDSLGGALSSLLVSPAEAGRRLGLPAACSNPACANLAGDSEAGLRLQRCGRCVRASYCCRECPDGALAVGPQGGVRGPPERLKPWHRGRHDMEVDGEASGSAATASGCHFYVVTAHKPTAVTHSVVASFTGPNDINLITACCTRLEIRTLGTGGLTPVLDVPIYGNISSLQVFRPRDCATDLLFILTEKYKFCVLQYDAGKGQLVTKANGDVADKIGRPADNGQLGFVDPACRLIGLHLYDGMLKVIPMDPKSGLLSEAFNLRLEELSVLDMAWLAPAVQAAPGGAGPSGAGSSAGGGAGKAPVLCVLHQDPKGARHVRTYEVQLGSKELTDGPWQQAHVDSGAGLLVPLPAPLGGVVVVGESVVTYLGGGGGAAPPVSAPLRQTIVTAWCRVDPDGSRLLLGDRQGGLSLLVVAHDGAGRVSGLRLEPLGHTSTPSCLAYLDSGVAFVGSRAGDSQLIRVSPTPVNQAAPMEDDDEAGGAAAAAGAAAEPPSYIELIESYPNLGPIVDFTVMDLERQGQGQLVTCSGIDADGSLRVIRNGIGINKQATVELAGIKGVWSLRSRYADEHDSHLLLTFVGETRLLALNEQEELDEAEIPGFDGGAQTLWCGNMASDHLVQVTSSSVRLVECGSLALASQWTPPPGFAINVAAGSPTQVVVATGGGHLVYLEVVQREGGKHEVVEVANVVLDSEVACVDVTPLQLAEAAPAGPTDAPAAAAAGSAERSSIVAVGRWDQTLQLLSVPSLAPLSSTPLGGEVIPRSVLCTALEGVPYCMVGLGDGALHTWRLDPATGALSERKRVVLGTKPISLRTFRTAAAAAPAPGAGANGGAATAAAGGRGGPGGVSVFAASDRPTVVYSSNKKLLYSNLNENDVAYLASFHAASLPNSLAVASEDALTLGTADAIQKLHTRTAPLGEQPRRIAHHTAAGLLAVLTQRVEPDGEERSLLRLLDDSSLDPLASFALGPGEMPCSLAAWPTPPGGAGAGAEGGSGSGGPPAWFVVGTALIRPEEHEPSRGRILVLEHSAGAGPGQSKVRLVTEKEVKGAVYNVLPFAKDRLLVSVNNKVTVYRWVLRDGSGGGGSAGPGQPELVSECSHLGNVLALYLAARGSLVVVGDLMRSVSLLSYNGEQGVLEHRAADYNSGWTTAVEALDDDTYLAADNHCNVYVVRRNADSATDEERARLQIVAEFHTGTFVNRLRHGSLVMRLPDSEHSGLPPPLLFAGSDGRLGVIARLPPPLFALLSKMQAAMRQVVRGVGGLDHEAWRSFANDRRSGEARGFVDGDLIESFLDLPQEDASRVVSLMGPDAPPLEELKRRVEDLARALH
ncbi:hypothetical protein HYH03_017282 [Edaphochlamys debaryana]|uniref:DNA damage-binding protein 1 n=1 Tax=Edaphochlamys debaryana TaxID=47281 RepID=A0A835XGX9_9CHLO|nr:hypothetical protein HYH03_017282 [Edaphochlamys debaryana]|eukprot:KAG2483888.1 hypothetical protein HYH03_017282 [Edaphochlamys debaryana]